MVTSTDQASEGPVPPDAATIDLRALFEAQRQAFGHEGEVTTAVRRDRLKRLQTALATHADELADAMNADFGTRPRSLSLSADVLYAVAEIAELRMFLRRWTKTEAPHRLLRAIGITHEIIHAPLGVVGVCGPWNFPIQLSMVPAAGAIAAGNRVMVRPSSVTRHTGEVLAAAVARYFDPAELVVITADHGSGSSFSKLPFGAFFFTGSTKVGREVARDCAANLVPVTLELGGKNPAVIDRDADIAKAAQRIALAKLFNGGQVCLSPDYAFVPRELLPQFVAEVSHTWEKSWPTIADSPEYTSIIDEPNYDRILRHIDDARSKGATVHQVVPPQETIPDRVSRKIPPTMITGLSGDMTIEDDEIFGPVLSVYAYDGIEQPIAFVNDRDTPLALYWYGPDNDRKRALVHRTRSGAVNSNEFMLHVLPGAGLPFGGVGASGFGRYHGKYSIETFSHARANVAYRGPFALSALLTSKKSAGAVTTLIRTMR